MSVPTLRSLSSEFTPRRLRAIEAEYHLELTARNTGEIVEQQAALLTLQAQAAEMNVRTAGELAHRQDRTNELLGSCFGQIADGLSHLTDVIGYGLGELDSTLSNGFRVVVADLRNISLQMWQQQQTLLEVVELLRQPYGTQSQELLREANKWLKQGTRHSGRDRDEDWKDAMGLLQEVIGNRIGKQDYLAWFQIGWLHWKHTANLEAGEEAFYQAQRLSAIDQAAFHVKSLRHQAYMQDLLGRCEDAYQTVKKARDVKEDHETLYDAARYAHKTSRKTESLELIDRCIDLQPTTIVTIFAEADFSTMPILGDLHELAQRRVLEARDRAKANLSQLEALYALVGQLEKRADVRIALPASSVSQIARDRIDITEADYLEALEIDGRTVGAFSEAKILAQDTFQSALAQRAAAVESIKEDIRRITKDRGNKFDIAKNAKQNAIRQAENERKVPLINPFENFQVFGCLGSITVVLVLSTLGTVSGITAVLVSFVFFVFGLCGYVTFPLMANLLMKLGAESRAREMVRVAGVTCDESIAAAKNRFKREMAGAKAALLNAEAQSQKAVEGNSDLKRSSLAVLIYRPREQQKNVRQAETE